VPEDHIVGIAYSGNRHSQDGRTPPPGSWDTQVKIEIFQSRVWDWTLAMTDLLDLSKDHRVNYAKLSIVISYFEMIGLYMAGVTADLIRTIKRIDPNRNISHLASVKAIGTNEDSFNKGLFDVAKTAGWKISPVKKAAKKLYPSLRCGLYHGGMARYGIWVSRLPPGNPFRVKNSDVAIDTTQLIQGIKKHFDLYISELQRLRQLGREEKRHNNKLTRFKRRFDIEVVDKLEEKYKRECLSRR